jgi:Ca-activated chloride channel family protein
VPLAVVGYWVLERRRARRLANWSRRALLPNIVRRPRGRLRYLPPALYLLGLIFLLVGFARPHRVLGAVRPQPPTVVFAFDTSGSMAARDEKPTRVGQARALAKKFLDALPSEYRASVVTFGDLVRVVVPPTLDHSAAEAGFPAEATPRAGTAIGDAVARSVAVITADAEESQAAQLRRPGAVVVFSDGRQNAGGTTLANAAVTALVDYIPVDTVAVGTRHASIVQRASVNGQTSLKQLEVPAQPAILRSLSQQTGGRFFDAARLERSPSLSGLFAGLNAPATHRRRTQGLSVAAGAVALACVIAAFAVSAAWFGRAA